MSRTLCSSETFARSQTSFFTPLISPASFDSLNIKMSLAGIPPEELPLIPALAPPNGTASNFVNPENRADAYIAVAGIFIGLAAISVMLRLYVRFTIQKRPWWDDRRLKIKMQLEFLLTML
jgi:hypothetical protein